MSLIRACQVLVYASLLFACSHASPPAACAPSAPVESEYVTIVPEVTYSRTGQDAASDIAPIGKDEDVMAAILAIPPGSAPRHDACTDCSLEATR
jgi:hypothetical protein